MKNVVYKNSKWIAINIICIKILLLGSQQTNERQLNYCDWNQPAL